jgi:hypothetical protein
MCLNIEIVLISKLLIRFRNLLSHFAWIIILEYNGILLLANLPSELLMITFETWYSGDQASSQSVSIAHVQELHLSWKNNFIGSKVCETSHLTSTIMMASTITRLIYVLTFTVNCLLYYFHSPIQFAIRRHDILVALHNSAWMFISFAVSTIQ